MSEQALTTELVEALHGLLIVQAGISDDPKAAQEAARAAIKKAADARNILHGKTEITEKGEVRV